MKFKHITKQDFFLGSHFKNIKLFLLHSKANVACEPCPFLKRSPCFFLAQRNIIPVLKLAHCTKLLKRHCYTAL
jgi:hypothetical protein